MVKVENITILCVTALQEKQFVSKLLKEIKLLEVAPEVSGMREVLFQEFKQSGALAEVSNFRFYDSDDI